MERYVVRLLLFLAPVLAVLACIEGLLRAIPNDYALKHSHLQNAGPELRFLILGNSHAYLGLDPERMPSRGFNAANISQDYRLDRAILERHLGHMPRLEHLFIPLSYGSLGAHLEEGSEAWRAKNYALYMGIAPDRFSLQHHLELLNRPMAEQLRMIQRHRASGKDNVLCSTSGWGAHASGTTDLALAGKEAAERHLRADRCAMGNADLDAIIALTSSHGINVHLFLPPAHVTYRDHLDPQQLANVRRMGAGLASTHAGVTFDDLLEDPRFLQEDFADADHLSAGGAGKLSAILSVHLR